MAERSHSIPAEGTDVGIIGGLAVAVWFLVLDTIAGHPLLTPSLLGQVVLMGDPTPDRSVIFGAILLYTAFNGSEQAKQDAAATFINWLATKDAQQIVSDTISLPIHKEITESSDPVRQETVQARGLDIPVWYDVPETNASFDTVSQNQGGLWTGRLTADQFAQIMQDSVKPSAA